MALASERTADEPDVHVLNLVTNDEARFYRQQVDVLERNGVQCTTLAVPGSHRSVDDVTRSMSDYLRFLPVVFRHSFDDYDIVHANYGLTAPMALAQPNLPVVVSLWGSDLMGRYGRVSKLCARRADEVIVMSEEMRAELDRPCHVIPHGIDTERFRPVPQDDARAAVGWDPEPFQVLFPYPETREVKNYPRARRIVERAREEFDRPIELQTLHSVPHERMYLYMNAADALLLTSHREGSPNSVKEAMACNLPVVSTDVGDVRSRLDGVHPSSVCRTDDELVESLVSTLRAGHRSNGREVICELSLQRMGERILDVYLEVLDRRERTVA